MAFLDKNDVAQIRKELNESFPQFKFGVVKRHSMEVAVTIKSGPTDFSSIFSDEYSAKRQYAQINAYHLDKFYGVHADFLGKIITIIKTAPSRGEGYHKDSGWYDRSDAMVDYFDTAYYISLHIGRWDKPYELV